MVTQCGLWSPNTKHQQGLIDNRGQRQAAAGALEGRGEGQAKKIGNLWVEVKARGWLGKKNLKAQPRTGAKLPTKVSHRDRQLLLRRH